MQLVFWYWSHRTSHALSDMQLRCQNGAAAAFVQQPKGAARLTNQHTSAGSDASASALPCSCIMATNSLLPLLLLGCLCGVLA
jgi:hypothetical protein